MSKHTGIKAASGVSPEVRTAVAATLWEQAAKQEADTRARKGKGVAWVQGREYRMPMPSVYYVSRSLTVIS